MANKSFKKVIITFFITTFFVITAYAGAVDFRNQTNKSGLEDFDPLVNIFVTVEIQAIRALDKIEYTIPMIEKIDWFGDPDFFVKIIIDDQEFESDVWENTKYIYDPQFSASFDVPDDDEFVDIKIQLYDKTIFGSKLCDISGEPLDNDIDLTYSIKTGHWTGDDKLGVTDPSGYGKLNGCDDGSIFARQKDCELWFNIYQTDPDGDGIPYWTEVNDYGTDPEVDNTGQDSDADDVPIEWEWKWGYDPFSSNNHKYLDPDDDGLNNYEEYLMAQWDSDPFRQDIYIEVDRMADSPDGEQSILPEGAKEHLRTAFSRYNKIIHIDDGCMGGGETIPFDPSIGRHELEDDIYWNYFLHGNNNNWRRGVFRYSVIAYDAGIHGYNFERGAFVLSSNLIKEKIIPNTPKTKDVVYASVYMHETGHTLGIDNPAVDNHQSQAPWQIYFWVYGPYKSCMNYRYTYRLIDYSDGSRIINDFNDWEQMDLTRFQN